MIFTSTPKQIRVMFTPFRDGLQSSFGGKARLQDFLPAMEASARAGIRHLEFGGGARFQAPMFYLGEDPFATMDKIRAAVGPDCDLQILTRSVSGVTLTTQSIEALELQGRLMAGAGTTWDRNFDYMNDVRNMINTGKPIVAAGMHHQVCIALMGLPFHSDKVHTAEFYIDIGKRMLEGDCQVDSICLKDASGTTDPKTIFDTAVGLRKIMPNPGDKKLPLRSRITTNGLDRAPHRAFMRGMGLDDDAISRPFVGIVTTANETSPCNAKTPIRGVTTRVRPAGAARGCRPR